MEYPNKQPVKRPFLFGQAICLVCCSTATGNHYEVDSCTGCKSFFKRVTISKTSYKCDLKGKCFDKLAVGKPVPNCKSCRYEKCKQVGMNALRFRFDKNIREPKRMIFKQPMLVESRICSLIDQLNTFELKYDGWDYSNMPISYPTLREMVNNNYRAVPMNSDAAHKILMVMFLDESVMSNLPALIMNEVRQSTYDIFMMIDLMKKFAFYPELAENDRYLLFRDSLIMVANLTKSFFSLDNKSDKLLRFDGLPEKKVTLPFKLPVTVQGDVNRQCLSPLIRLNISKTEFYLLRAIVISNPNIYGLSEHGRQILTASRNEYTMSLFYHTMAKYQKPDRFASLISIISLLEHQQKSLRDVVSVLLLYRKLGQFFPLLDCVAIPK